MQQNFTFRFQSHPPPFTDAELFELCLPKPLNNRVEEYHWSLFFDNNPTLRNDLYSGLNKMHYSHYHGLIYDSSLVTWKLFKEYFKSKTNARNIRVSPLHKPVSGDFTLTPFVVHITQCKTKNDIFDVNTKFLNLTDVSGVPENAQDSWGVRKIDVQEPSIAVHDFGPTGPIWFEFSQ